jgi:hypothetical protein
MWMVVKVELACSWKHLADHEFRSSSRTVVELSGARSDEELTGDHVLQVHWLVALPLRRG